MNKKTIAIILEIITVAAVLISCISLSLHSDSEVIRNVIRVTILLSFLGFGFSFIGKKLAKEETSVRVLGALDWMATIYVVAIYVIAFFSFGL